MGIPVAPCGAHEQGEQGKTESRWNLEKPLFLLVSALRGAATPRDHPGQQRTSPGKLLPPETPPPGSSSPGSSGGAAGTDLCTSGTSAQGLSGNDSPCLSLGSMPRGAASGCSADGEVW